MAKNLAKLNSLKTELIGLSPICDEDDDRQNKRMLFEYPSHSSSNFSLGSTTSSSLLDTLMPTLRNYDENGILKSTTDQSERLTSFDSFMQELDDDYDKRKQQKAKPIQKKPSEVQKTTTAPPEPLTLDGPIEYRDKKLKKKPAPMKKAKAKPQKKPAIISSSSDDDENGETNPSQMVYDEDEAW